MAYSRVNGDIPASEKWHTRDRKGTHPQVKGDIPVGKDMEKVTEFRSPRKISAAFAQVWQADKMSETLIRA